MKNLKKTLIIAFSLPIFLLYNSCDTTDPGDNDTGCHNKILFTSRSVVEDGKEQLFMMNPDGTEIKQITSGQYCHFYGRWSPDAQKIVCMTDENYTTAGIKMVVMNPDGTERKLLGSGGAMNWSPNNEDIIFEFKPRAELGDRTSNIYATNYISKKTKILVDSLGVINMSPAYSPDGNTIVFSSNIHSPAPPMKSEIYLMNLTEKKIVRKTYLNAATKNPVWSSDGNTIYFNSNGMIYNINLSDNSINKIKELEGYVLVMPCLSPDEKKILVLGYLGGDRGHLFIMDKNGENLKRLLEDNDYVTSCDWSK